MSRDLRRDPPLPRLVFGVAVVAAGAIFWLDNIGRIEARDYLEWWPLALIALGVAQLPYRKWIAAAWWLLVGTYFLLPMIGFSRAPLGYVLGLWPLLISAGGAVLVRQALRPGVRSIGAVAVMGGNVQKVGGRFTDGDAVAVMGGCDLDFTAATVAGEAVLDVLAFWGGVEIKVPRGWQVVNRASLILGGLVMKLDPAPPGAPRLVIRGSAIMGGIEVRHPRESAA